ncbi:MAG: phosphatase PAP2 family protein [Rickettsiales bacterium]|jgi:membrane-associated phospholipid phosphatase|nr:phosphatase PAP2 family protein [Rickettsiales bacterium]
MGKFPPPARTIALAFLLLSAHAANARAGLGAERSGDWLQLLIPISALAYSASISDWKGAEELLLSAGATAAATHALKSGIKEDRPNQPEDTEGSSFPSGHTSFAFSGAAYWQTRYGWGIGAPMYAAASYVGWTRVDAGKHRWPDVLAGAALGIGINLLFVDAYPGANVSVVPTDGGAAVHISSKF